jgi:hypothetical protein
LLVTASANVLVPLGLRIPVGSTNVCCGPTIGDVLPQVSSRSGR